MQLWNVFKFWLFVHHRSANSIKEYMALSAEQTLILVLFYVSTKGEHGIETKISTFLDWFFPKNLLLKPAATQE